MKPHYFTSPLTNRDNNDIAQQSEPIITTVFRSIAENINYLEINFLKSQDLKNRRFVFNQKECIAFYFETLVDQDKLQQNFFLQLSEFTSKFNEANYPFRNLSNTTSLDEVTQKLLAGFSAIYIDGEQRVFFIETAANFARSSSEPENERVIRGSHQGFVENLTINLNLIRHRIVDKSLYVEYITLGDRSNTKVALTYIKGLADENIVETALTRLESISTDMVFSTEFLEEFIEDSTASPFPQMLNTERPDRVEANLMEGKIAILSEGSPTALLIPSTFFAFYQSPDDYNSRVYVGTFIRVIRLFSFVVAVTLPAIYIAVIGFHYGVMPQQLAITVKGSIDNIPYPPLVEAFIMELTIELIREAGIRLPSAIGTTISIVGGLVIGDAIVKAGLVSNTMIVVVAMTAIACYVVPSSEMSSAVRLLRFPMMLAASILGFVGIVFGLMILLIHLCKLESFGSPYFAPVAPFRWNGLKDAILRMPIFWNKNRHINRYSKKMKK
ncbi:MAG: spore germination protein [Candidatus Pristimantibacillus lignocellulolyticus]|uniref:Spore germination protein n=1 Tax=Candidatus Pristimantibacillus lignocellulolyticus TaxID=2994561 RepID=A0A9J6ZJ22_9BACL|nr:MAG: spore germination protein [Candidatus Pristimantibacillus lignocellulolyticus]